MINEAILLLICCNGLIALIITCYNRMYALNTKAKDYIKIMFFGIFIVFIDLITQKKNRVFENV